MQQWVERRYEWLTFLLTTLTGHHADHAGVGGGGGAGEDELYANRDLPVRVHSYADPWDAFLRPS